ncbi:hypothetical protein CesoFtcFv8_002403 [Champsocephalus esox]|uniref:Uncharacterized protein n=1 Tax=Champsocephalus esox TaxID=159716 RepID=A0AAN8D2M8_9TELE|nr:hypothetical protein CesoFtcFv8_002403 [Champsocephalus esox]
MGAEEKESELTSGCGKQVRQVNGKLLVNDGADYDSLFPTGEYYLDRNYDEVVKRLWIVHFIPAIWDALHQNHLHVSERRVFGATEAILHNLRNTRLFEAKIEKLYKQLVENDETQLKITTAAWAFWQH